MKVQIKRLWHGVASIRDYLVGQAMDDEEDLDIILLETGEVMTIPWKDLKEGKSNLEKFHSIHDNFDYSLVDYVWKANKSNQKKLI